METFSNILNTPNIHNTHNTHNTLKTPSSVSGPIGDFVTSQPQIEFDDIQSVDFETISNWFSDSMEKTTSSMIDWDSEVPSFFFDLDSEFNF
jgi:hypothetical protein